MKIIIFSMLSPAYYKITTMYCITRCYMYQSYIQLLCNTMTSDIVLSTLYHAVYVLVVIDIHI